MAPDVAERMIYPAMPICLAYVCCILNFIIPGLGTVLAGVSTFCCAKNDDMDIGDRFTSCCCGLFFGLMQLIFTAFLLIGWFWSAVWGCGYIDMSKKYFPRTTNRRTVHPNIHRLPVTHQPYSRHHRDRDVHVSVIPFRREFIPPPSYQEITRGGEVGVHDSPPSYDSLYPERGQT